MVFAALTLESIANQLWIVQEAKGEVHYTFAKAVRNLRTELRMRTVGTSKSGQSTYLCWQIRLNKCAYYLMIRVHSAGACFY